jgi:hypothetical protein
MGGIVWVYAKDFELATIFNSNCENYAVHTLCAVCRIVRVIVILPLFVCGSLKSKTCYQCREIVPEAQIKYGNVSALQAITSTDSSDILFAVQKKE